MTDAFSAHREHLLGVARRMLGSRADAEDVVQEACRPKRLSSPASRSAPRACSPASTTG
ncbi:hypothetical protein Drose_02885 [Dactylosporangium roseum]|uniref:RNA polymerase sigma-70 region 2 domain-containing protein n=1 Tax=Dactylosporangium roseum TaxID=47989 RepID=A0ABY5Z5G6_9ACTN|nr:hypothetical protein Drose_02885 [Dactylosporangium roseum]